MSTPYTYLIYCIPTNQFYYGVRFSKNCHPSDLWVTYFTSSKYVKNLIKQYGKHNFKFKIRKIFNDTNSAKIWEQKVLRRLRVSSRKDFLNKYDFMFFDKSQRVWVNKDNKNKFIPIEELNNFITKGWNKGRYFTKDHKDKISNSKKGINNRYNFKHTQDSKNKMSSKRLGKKLLGENPNSKIVVINNVVYDSILEASYTTGLSYYKIKKYYFK